MGLLNLFRKEKREPVRASVLCQLSMGEDGKEPPRFVELIPAGNDVRARDGRRFRNEEPGEVVRRFIENNLDVVIDWEHATEVRAPFGEMAPAAGWITALDDRNGAIWGEVEWTPRGAESIQSREYRYISPAFEMDENGVVLKLVSAGLTNRPALDLMELAREQQTTEDEPMDKELLEILGLGENATPQEVTAAVTKLKEQSGKVEEVQTELTEVQGELASARQKAKDLETKVETFSKNGPSLDNFVPRSDYDLALARVQKLEDENKRRDEEARETAICSAVDAAVKEGKITPANREFYVQSCRAEGGLERFSEFVKAAPVVAPTVELVHNVPDTLTDVELNAAKQVGVSAEDVLKAKQRIAERRAQG